MWDGVLREKSAVRSLTRFDPSIFRSHNAAEVPDFDPNDFIESKRARRLDRFGQFSVAAAKQAIEDSELDLAVEDRERVGAMMGTALGGVGYAEEQLSVFLREGLRAVDATLALAVFGGAASCNIAIELGVSGPNSTNAMSCASGAMAIGESQAAIDLTLDYVKTRKAFGAPLWEKQAIRQRLAELAGKVEAGRQLVYHAAWLDAQGFDATREVSMVKAYCGELVNEVMYDCLQFHGGMGYMRESAIERMTRDARVQSIGGGATEVMLEEVAKRL